MQQTSPLQKEKAKKFAHYSILRSNNLEKKTKPFLLFLFQFLNMIHYWCDDENTKKDFITTCATQFKTEFSQLFGDIFARSYCSVIRTSILEVALALTSAGLPLNGFNFDKVGLKAASAEAAAEHDGENLVKTSE